MDNLPSLLLFLLLFLILFKNTEGFRGTINIPNWIQPTFYNSQDNMKTYDYEYNMDNPLQTPYSIVPSSNSESIDVPSFDPMIDDHSYPNTISSKILDRLDDIEEYLSNDNNYRGDNCNINTKCTEDEWNRCPNVNIVTDGDGELKLEQSSSGCKCEEGQKIKLHQCWGGSDISLFPTPEDQEYAKQCEGRWKNDNFVEDLNSWPSSSLAETMTYKCVSE